MRQDAFQIRLDCEDHNHPKPGLRCQCYLCLFCAEMIQNIKRNVPETKHRMG